MKGFLRVNVREMKNGREQRLKSTGLRRALDVVRFSCGYQLHEYLDGN